MSSLGNKEVMAANIQRFMDRDGLSRNEVCQALGVKYTTFTDWLNAKTYPRIDKIETMANFFGVSKADLVEEYSPTPDDRRRNELFEKYGELFEDLDGLPESQQKEIEDFIRFKMGQSDE